MLNGQEGVVDKDGKDGGPGDVKNCYDWCISVFNGQNNDEHCKSDQCSECDFCSQESKEKRAAEHAEASKTNAEDAAEKVEQEKEKAAKAEQQAEKQIADAQKAAEENDANIKEEAAKAAKEAEKETKEAEKAAEKETETENFSEAATVPTGRAAQPAGTQGGTVGDDCWTACDKTPGSCFDADKGKGFCGKKGEWSGSCCRRDAVGEQQSPDCADRGCDGMHCCVADPS